MIYLRAAVLLVKIPDQHRPDLSEYSNTSKMLHQVTSSCYQSWQRFI